LNPISPQKLSPTYRIACVKYCLRNLSDFKVYLPTKPICPKKPFKQIGIAGEMFGSDVMFCVPIGLAGQQFLQADSF